MPTGVYQRRDMFERFWAKVKKTDSCWLWTGAKAGNGYGNFNLSGAWRQAHIVSYEMIKGNVPDGFELDHLCRNPLCVNPDHLEVVTHRENLLRGNGFSAKAVRVTHCPQGHPYDLFNTYFRPDGSGHRDCLICRRENARRRYHQSTEPQATDLSAVLKLGEK